MNIETLVLLLMKNVNNFQIEKIHPQIVLSICLSFCQFQPGVTYKESVAYKKSVSYNFLKCTGWEKLKLPDRITSYLKEIINQLVVNNCRSTNYSVNGSIH